MKRILFIFIGAVLIATLLNSCSDSDGDNIYNIPDAKLIPVRIYNDIGTIDYKYSYDNQNRITQIDFKPGYYLAIYPPESLPYSIYKITYDKQNRIDSLICMHYVTDALASYRADTTTYKYNGNIIEANSKNSVSYIEIDNQEKILENKTQTLNGTGSYITIHTYEYDTNNNKISFTSIESKNSYGYQYTYTYDNKNGIFKYVNMPQWFLVSQIEANADNNIANNCITEKNIDSQGTITISYNYSFNNYPRSFTTNYSGFMPANYIPVQEVETKIEYKEIK